MTKLKSYKEFFEGYGPRSIELSLRKGNVVNAYELLRDRGIQYKTNGSNVIQFSNNEDYQDAREIFARHDIEIVLENLQEHTANAGQAPTGYYGSGRHTVKLYCSTPQQAKKLLDKSKYKITTTLVQQGTYDFVVIINGEYDDIINAVQSLGTNIRFNGEAAKDFNTNIKDYNMQNASADFKGNIL